jgi:hypothetical protein
MKTDKLFLALGTFALIGSSVALFTGKPDAPAQPVAAVTLKPVAVVEKHSDFDAEKVRSLVKLYSEGSGGEEIAAALLVRMGDAARSELLAMQRDEKITRDEAGAVAEILLLYFSASGTARVAVGTPAAG